MKSPAFQFYPDDFLGSGKVGQMTPEEVGVYVLLLCLEWNDVGFTFDNVRLARWCRMTPAKFAAAWRTVQDCFVERDGRLFNPRLDAEREKQRAYSERMAANGRKGGRPRAPEKPELSNGFPPQKPEVSSGFSEIKPIESTPSPSPTPSLKQHTTTALGADAPARPARKPKAPPSEGLEVLPKATSDAVFDAWRKELGGVDYGRLRKALLQVFSGAPARFSEGELVAAVGAFEEGRSTDNPKWRGKWTPEKFASELPEWVRLGKMELTDDYGLPTERGRASGIFGVAS